MFTLKDVRKMLKELDEITGFNGAGLELKTTNTKRTLASHVHRITRTPYGEVVSRTPVRFEFSKLILSCDEETLREVVKHEYAHYMALVEYNDNCGHDWRFKKMCEVIGASADEPTFTNNSIQEQSVKMAKYVVTCNKCGHVYTYSRMCNTLKSVQAQDGTVRCACGCHDLTLTQNY